MTGSVLAIAILVFLGNLWNDFSFVSSVRGLSEWDAMESAPIIRELGRKKCFISLYLVILEKPNLEEHAASAICENGGYDSATCLCAILREGTPAWRTATRWIGNQKKEQALPHFLRTVAELSPQNRAFCYQMFAARHWPELREIAIQDQDSGILIGGRNDPIGLAVPTVGEIARSYLMATEVYLIRTK